MKTHEEPPTLEQIEKRIIDDHRYTYDTPYINDSWIWVRDEQPGIDDPVFIYHRDRGMFKAKLTIYNGLDGACYLLWKVTWSEITGATSGVRFVGDDIAHWKPLGIVGKEQ
jgi:hypothetical protein